MTAAQDVPGSRTALLSPPSRSGLARRLSAVARDPMLRSSLFLMATSGVTAALGFVFWLVCARIYRAEDIGVASTVLSAASLLGYLSLFGMNNLIVRRAAVADGGSLLAASVVLVTTAGTAVALVYVVSAPWIAQDLAAALADPLRATVFTVLSVAAAVNVLTDAAFVSRRATHWNLVLDGGLQGTAKLVLVVVLAGLGAAGLVVASTAAVVMSAAVSLAVLWARFGMRVAASPAWGEIRLAGRFSAGTYVSSALNLLPLLTVPPIVLRALGDREAGHYFIAFQVANLVFTLCYAVGESLFAEGALGRDLAELRQTSGLAMAAVAGTAVAGAEVAGPWILQVFGPGYADAGTPALRILVLGALAVAVNLWASFLLKAVGRTGWLIASNVVYAVAIIALSLAWAPAGLTGVAWAWGAGNALSAAVALVPVLRRAGRGAAPQDQAGAVPMNGGGRRPLRIAVVNAYVRENAGDAALLSVILAQVREAAPGARIEVFSMEDPAHRPSFELHPNRGSIRRYVADGSATRSCRILRRALVGLWAVAALTAPAGAGAVLRRLLPAEARHEAEAMTASDLVVSIGGGYFRGGRGLEGTQNVVFVLLPLLLAQKAGRDVVFAPQSFGPFHGTVQRYLVRRCAGSARLLLAREDESLKWLADCGVPPSLPRRAIDSGFSLQPGAGRDWRAEWGLVPDDLILGVTARAWLPPAGQEAYERRVAAAIDHCQEHLGLRAVLIPQVATSYLADDDRTVQRRIAGYCRTAPIEVEELLTPGDLASMYRQLHVLIGTRFHSVVFSLTGMVPALAVAYEHKATGIMADLGLSEWVVPIEQVAAEDTARFLDRVSSLVAQAGPYRETLRRIIPAYVGQSAATVAQLREVVVGLPAHSATERDGAGG